MGCHDGDTLEDYHNSSSIKEYRVYHLETALDCIDMALAHSYDTKAENKIRTIRNKIDKLLNEEGV